MQSEDLIIYFRLKTAILGLLGIGSVWAAVVFVAYGASVLIDKFWHRQ
jgi:hypothetical protein